MISFMKKMSVFLFILLANFLPNSQLFVLSEHGVQTYGGNKLEDKSLCSGFEEKLDTMAKTVGALQKYMNSVILEVGQLKMLRENLYESRLQEAKRKSPPNILEVKCANDRLPSSCYEVGECQNNLYHVKIANFSESSFPVLCDFTTDDKGWTVIQRRQDGSVNFNRNWTEYVHGFGDMDGEFFIGLEKLHALTTLGAKQQLYVIVEDFEGERRYAKYNLFHIDSEDTDYKLTVRSYSGNAGDSLSPHNGYKFSTWDRDNTNKCGLRKKGGWWFGNNYCYYSFLNGKYRMGKMPESGDYFGVAWAHFRGVEYSLKFTQMMIRPSLN